MTTCQPTCRNCNSPTVPVLSVEHYPLAGGPVQLPGSPRVPLCTMSVAFCPNCTLYSLSSPDPATVAYNADYVSSNARELDDKFDLFFSFLSTVRAARALEIGCFNGELMLVLRDRLGWTVKGCDPCAVAADIARGKGLHVVTAEFSPALYCGEQFDAIVCRNVLEHIAAPGVFLRDVRALLAPDGALFIAVPDGETRIRDGILGSIVPEHPFYYSDASLFRLLRSCGLEPVAHQRIPGTIMVEAIRSQAVTTGTAITATALTDRAAERAAKVHELVGDSLIYLYGANSCSVELLARGAVHENAVVAAVDDHPYKLGKTLMNTGIPVFRRAVLSAASLESAVVICSYYSQDKIVDWLRKHRRKPWSIITLYPEPRRIEL